MTQPRLSPLPQTGAITIANGTGRGFNRGGNFVRVKEADQTFTIIVDNGTEWTVEQNDWFQLEPGDEFKHLYIQNDSGSSLTFQLEVGFGRVGSSKTTISGAVKVKNADAPNDILKVDDDATQTALASILAMLQNSTAQRPGITDLSGASYVEASNATTTLATAGANTAGVLFRHALSSNYGTNYNSYITIGGNNWLESQLGSTTNILIEKDVLTPSGVQVDAVSGGVSAPLQAYYEVL